MKRTSAVLSLARRMARAAALPAVAHHGTLVSYDRDKQWTREAVVTRFNYANPHPQIFFDVHRRRGNVEHWSGELLPNPAGLLRVGWTKVAVAASARAGHENQHHDRAGARGRRRRLGAQDHAISRAPTSCPTRCPYPEAPPHRRRSPEGRPMPSRAA